MSKNVREWAHSHMTLEERRIFLREVYLSVSAMRSRRVAKQAFLNIMQRNFERPHTMVDNLLHWALTSNEEALNHMYERMRNAWYEEERAEQLAQAERQRLEEELMEKQGVNFSKSMTDLLYELQNKCCVVSDILLRRHKTINTFGNYVTTRGEMLSFLPAGKEHKITESGKWARDGRQEMRPAKLARKLIREEYLKHISDKDFETFSNNVSSYISIIGDEDGEGKKVRLEVVKGKDIARCYKGTSYSPMFPNSNLWGSCMRYDSCENFFGIYTDNSNCSMLVAFDNKDMVLGRALLWKFTDGDKGMDTIYADEKLRGLFRGWAIDNGYLYKSEQSCHHHNFDMFEGGLVQSKARYVKLEEAYFDYYPYCDTIYMLDKDKRMLHNDFSAKADMELRDTDGNTEDNDDRVWSDWHGEDIDEECARYCCYTRPNGDRIDSYVIENDVVYNSRDDRYYLDEDAVYVSGDYYLTDDDRIQLLDNGDYVLEEHASYCNHDDIWIRSNDAFRCAHDDEEYSREYMAEASDGQEVYEGNLAEYEESIKENA